MRSRTRLALGAVALLAGWMGWGWYVNNHTDRIPFEPVRSLDGVELRRYPRTVLVETTAPSTTAAFGRLFRYLSGANEPPGDGADGGGQQLAMTAPVRTIGGTGERVSMTAPVRTEPGAGPVTMAFYLPASYGPETAPVPTDPTVRLVIEPARTVAAKRFSWYATAGRTDQQERALLDAVVAAGLEPRGEPFLLQYNDPWTPPFMRRNEVVVEVDGSLD